MMLNADVGDWYERIKNKRSLISNTMESGSRWRNDVCSPDDLK